MRVRGYPTPCRYYLSSDGDGFSAIPAIWGTGFERYRYWSVINCEIGRDLVMQQGIGG